MIAELLRHGATDDGGPAILRGRRDDALTAEGWAQMRAATSSAPRQGRDAWQAVVTSPLRRCAEFARELAEARGLPLLTDARLAELDFGAWDGRAIDSLMQDAAEAEALRGFWRDPWRYPPPRGETLADFQTRVRSAWRDIAARHTGRRVLIVSHGGVIRLLLCTARGLPRHRLLEIDVPHASLHPMEVAVLPELREHD